MGQTDVIDKAALKRLLDVIGGDPEDLQELLEEFEATTPTLLAAMQNAAAAGDLGELRIAAHSLKSNGRDFGATALATACHDLEAACKNGTVEGPVGQVEIIASELTRAREALSGIAL